MSLILHCTTQRAWEDAAIEGAYTHDSLAREGFVHCSTPEQIVTVANIRFRGQSGLVLLCVDEERLRPEVHYENCEGGTLMFPHVYGPINLEAVIQVLDFPCESDGSFKLPALPSLGSGFSR